MPALSFSSRLTGAAFILLALALFVAPFRGSAGLRGGLLLLAFLLVAADAARQRAPQMLFPQDALLRWSLAAWAGVLFARAAAGETPLASLGDWKGDIATPLAAFCVAHAVMRLGGVVAFERLLLAVFATLPILLLALIVTPFRQEGLLAAPLYGVAGAVSAWLVSLAALLPWWWRRRSVSRGIVVAAALAMVVAGFCTGSRWFWVCLAALTLTVAAASVAVPPWRRWGAAVLLLVLLGACFVSATAWRFGEAPQQIATTFNDHRQLIYAGALKQIAAAPVIGHGVGRDALAATMLSQFTEPEHRRLFLHAHNVFLDQALQAGIVAAVALAAFFGILLWRAWQWARHASPVRAAVGLTLLLVVFGCVVRNFTDDFFLRQNAILFFALTGGLLGLLRSMDDSTPAL